MRDRKLLRILHYSENYCSLELRKHLCSFVVCLMQLYKKIIEDHHGVDILSEIFSFNRCWYISAPQTLQFKSSQLLRARKQKEQAYRSLLICLREFAWEPLEWYLFTSLDITRQRVGFSIYHLCRKVRFTLQTSMSIRDFLNILIGLCRYLQ